MLGANFCCAVSDISLAYSQVKSGKDTLINNKLLAVLRVALEEDENLQPSDALQEGVSDRFRLTRDLPDHANQFYSSLVLTISEP